MELQTSGHRMEEVFRVREALADVSASLFAMESAERGFVIGQNPEHLAIYAAAGNRLRAARATLEGLGPDVGLAELWPLVDGKIHHMDAVFELVTSRPEAIPQLIRAGEGRGWMRRVREEISRISDRLDQDLQSRRGAAVRSLQNDVAVSAILTATLAAVLVFIHVLMVRERGARDAFNALQDSAQLELERNVAIRTSELLETSEQLRASETRFRTVFNAVPEAILSVDDQQIVTLANPAASRTFGFDSEELIGKPLSDLIPTRFRADHQLSVREFARKQGETRQMGRNAEVSGLRKDGVEFPAEATIASVRFAGASMYTVVLRDITERLRADAAVKESERWLRTVLEALPDAVLVNSQGRVSYVNSRAERLFGSNSAGIVGREALSLFGPDFHPLMQDRLQQLLSGARSLPTATVAVRALDGRLVEAESSVALIKDPDGWAVVMCLRDLTHIRAIEGELSESRDRLRLLVHAQVTTQETERRRIAMELHDDLQQTMAAIKMDIAAAMKVQGESLREAEALLRSAGELTDAALQSTRRIVNDLRPQMLDDLGLEAALESLAAEHGRRTGADSRFVGTGHVDETRLPLNTSISLFRIAQEALNNAAKHAGAGHVWVRMTVTPQDIGLVIEDDGVGIRDEDREKLNAFGLHGMAERVAALGGRLDVARRRGGGTQVAARIPMSTPSA